MWVIIVGEVGSFGYGCLMLPCRFFFLSRKKPWRGFGHTSHLRFQNVRRLNVTYRDTQILNRRNYGEVRVYSDDKSLFFINWDIRYIYVEEVLQIPHLRPTEYRTSRLHRHKKTVNRAYGGNLAGSAVRERYVNHLFSILYNFSFFPKTFLDNTDN